MKNSTAIEEKFRVQVVDLDYYRRNIPCQYACPAQTDARGYVQAIAQGEYGWGYRIARQPNPFATACGRVCVAPCETACRRGKVDTPIPIRALKRFVTQRFGVEGQYSFPAGALQDKQDNSRTWESHWSLMRRRDERGRRVAVIGSGPAGLTAAHDLALLGYRITVFEALPIPGGYMAAGIPSYRLPRELVRREVEAILGLGVELKTGSPFAWNREVPISLLREQGYEAVFLATGVEKKQRISAPEEGILAEADMGIAGHGIIHAVATGHRAAAALDGYFQGKEWRIERRGWLVPVDMDQFYDLRYLHQERRDPPTHPFPVTGELESSYSEEEAVEQARRCFNCNIQTVFDGTKCILCNACVDVCPLSCLKLVRIDSIQMDQPVTAFIQQQTQDGHRPVAAMLKDETRCIRCGLCHRRCPTGAVRMLSFWYEEELVYG